VSVVSRRTVAAGLAWSVPTIVLTAQAVAHAASTTPTPTLTAITGCTSKTGTNVYNLTMTFDSSLAGHTLVITAVYIDTTSPPVSQVQSFTQPSPTPTGATATFAAVSTNNAGNVFIRIDYTIDGKPRTYTTTAKVSVNRTCP